MTTTEIVLSVYPLAMAAIVGGGALLLANWLDRSDDRRALEMQQRSAGDRSRR